MANHHVPRLKPALYPSLLIAPPWSVSPEDSRLPEIGLDAREFFDGGRGGGDGSSESSSPQLPDLSTSGIGRGGGRSNVLLKRLTLEDMVGGRPEKLLNAVEEAADTSPLHYYGRQPKQRPHCRKASFFNSSNRLSSASAQEHHSSRDGFGGNPLSTDELWSVCFPGYTSVDIAGTSASNPYMLTGNPGTFTPLKGVALVLQA